VNQIRSDGRFRYRVSEYKGNSNDNSERLKLSEANVAVYTTGGYLEYRVGKDGFIKVRHLESVLRASHVRHRDDYRMLRPTLLNADFWPWVFPHPFLGNMLTHEESEGETARATFAA
jgi:hypothetical protein